VGNYHANNISLLKMYFRILQYFCERRKLRVSKQKLKMIALFLSYNMHQLYLLFSTYYLILKENFMTYTL
jgi:hypothetical protein